MTKVKKMAQAFFANTDGSQLGVDTDLLTKRSVSGAELKFDAVRCVVDRGRQ